MKTLLFAKGGGPMYTRDFIGRASASGEQGESEGTLRHLCERDDLRVIYFGQSYGELPCESYRPMIDGLTEMSNAAVQEAYWDVDEIAIRAMLGDDECIGFLNIAGYSPTFSWIANPNYATVQAAAVRYTGPMNSIIERLKLPRLVVNNDPRTYPKDQEMSYGWDHIRPVALLDQWGDQRVQVVGGKKYLRRSIWAKCESWGYLKRYENLGIERCVVLAHAHVDTGTRNGSFEPWHRILDGTSYPIYGAGWDGFPQWQGAVRPKEVQEILKDAICCPVLFNTPGFYTGKCYVLESCGCIPILYGDGSCPHTADPREQWQLFSDPRRVVFDLDRVIDERDIDEERREWNLRCLPDWRLLDQMIDNLLDGLDISSDAWFKRYGGYRQLTG
jgi:hypothetical protein